ncbi:PREDICTED: uncharacterized protein LOC108554258 [Eufriesea mexicana]|uniref:uncharacterized protein LOC108554258 n=1 Tax=Eufriesea mexicana TaxID=516756 RepID=UPI00083BAC18|nr:PREDICTED: uncharacterized protein LOC108554258 [Eufriesea mexicana]
MKVINYVCYIFFVLVCLMNMVHSENPQNKIEQQFLNALTADESQKMKRPFCNTFSGCGKKRNFYENRADSPNQEESGSIRLPLSVYKALLRAASQNVRNTIERDMNEYQLSGLIPQVYFSGRMPLPKRFDIPSSSLE